LTTEILVDGVGVTVITLVTTCVLITRSPETTVVTVWVVYFVTAIGVIVEMSLFVVLRVETLVTSGWVVVVSTVVPCLRVEVEVTASG